jgi:hypothetical protein
MTLNIRLAAGVLLNAGPQGADHSVGTKKVF